LKEYPLLLLHEHTNIERIDDNGAKGEPVNALIVVIASREPGFASYCRECLTRSTMPAARAYSSRSSVDDA
jgi:hypothetical protein